MKRFEWVEHPSDVGFRAYGKTLAEAFENAALALFEIMTDTSKVEPKEMVKLELQAEDKEALLYDWLDSLISYHDSQNLLFSKFEVKIERSASGLCLEGKAWGEAFNPEKHPAKTSVKAMTYHMMRVEEKPGACCVQAVVDI